MNNGGILESFLSSNSEVDRTDNSQTEEFINDQKDPLITQLNTAVAELSGLSRQRILLAKILDIATELSEDYLLFRKGVIPRSDYLKIRLKKEQNISTFIGEQLFKGAVYDSGSSMQFVQMVRKLGILTDNKFGENFDVNVLKQNEAVDTRLKTLFAYLREQGLPESYILQILITNANWNEILMFLVTLLKKIIMHLTITEIDSPSSVDPFSSVKDQLLLIKIRLEGDLSWLYTQYAHNQCSFPSGFQSLLLKIRINKKYLEAKLEEHARLKSYENLFFQADALGYEQNATNDLFRKVLNCELEFN